MKKAANLRPKLSEIHYEKHFIHDTAPTIILLHDSLGCTTLWRDFPMQLTSALQCNVVVYDRQGYGKSCPFAMPERDDTYLEVEADILIDLMDFWKIKQAILFGHSDGGSISIIAAAKYPERIQGIITEGAHIFVEPTTLQGIQDAIQMYHNSPLKQRLEKYHGDKTDALFWAWAGTWNLPEYADWNIEHLLPSIQCPALIIQGTEDEFGTLAQVYQVIAQTSGPSEGVVLPNIGHNPHKECPTVVIKLVEKFLNHYLK